jgi:phenylacetate-coenzyme A ligase PaaK-like adenylate-forming protein
MDPRYETTRLIDVARMLRLAARSVERERWPREQLARFQQERLEALVAHARARSPYYRERIGGGPVELAALPALDKATLMEHFDDISPTADCAATSCSRTSTASSTTTCISAATGR